MLLRHALALLVPPCCAACRAPCPPRALLCAACAAALPWLRDPCPRCALPRPCGACPAARAAFSAAWAPVAYAGPARGLVVALKFRAALPAAAVMAAQIAARAPRALLAGAAIVPVPAAPARRRRRGFDPAERLAAELARRTGRPVAPCLRRGGTAGRQLGARRAERLGRRRLAVTADGDAPATALLVDDVHTTGATLDACARALRAAGSRDVRAIAYARTLRGA